MANYKRHAAALLLALAVAGGAAGCGALLRHRSPHQDAPVPETTQPQPWTAWDPVAVTINAVGERCFALSAQTFLQRYNTLWSADWGEDLLPALEEWTDYGVGTSPATAGWRGGSTKPARTHQLCRALPRPLPDPDRGPGDGGGRRVGPEALCPGARNLFSVKALYSLRVFFRS